MSLVDREAEVEELELSKVAVEDVSAGGVVSCAAHVLAQTMDGTSLLCVLFRVVLVGDGDISFEGRDPVDLVSPLERDGYHGRLRHGFAVMRRRGGGGKCVLLVGRRGDEE